MNAQDVPFWDAASSSAAQTLNSAFRRTIPVVTENAIVSKGIRRYGMKLGAGRFVAGETLEDCLEVLKALNSQGLRVNTTILGEGVSDAAAAAAVVQEYEIVLDRLVMEGIDGNVALKLTHLGLTIDENLAHDNMLQLVERARQRGTFIRIDMEDSPFVDATLRIYRRLREAGYDKLGTVLQSYLFRTERDLTELLPLEPNLRLVKGAYLEPKTVAFEKKADVDENYVRLAKRMLLGNSFTAIATHDERIIATLIEFANQESIPHDRFEFQMLYGIRPQLQLDLVAKGYRVLVATPYGTDWYHYLVRRLAERPANLFFVVKNVVRG